MSAIDLDYQLTLLSPSLAGPDGFRKVSSLRNPSGPARLPIPRIPHDIYSWVSFTQFSILHTHRVRHFQTQSLLLVLRPHLSLLSPFLSSGHKRMQDYKNARCELLALLALLAECLLKPQY